MHAFIYPCRNQTNIVVYNMYIYILCIHNMIICFYNTCIFWFLLRPEDLSNVWRIHKMFPLSRTSKFTSNKSLEIMGWWRITWGFSATHVRGEKNPRRMTSCVDINQLGRYLYERWGWKSSSCCGYQHHVEWSYYGEHAHESQCSMFCQWHHTILNHRNHSALLALVCNYHELSALTE